jgi:uncharacterized repeat protein (TIGR03987 family)
MNTKLLIAIICITMALIIYTTGVFLEKHDGFLTKKHIILFCLGLFFDSTGTYIMSTLSTSNNIMTVHGITGAIAICLMFVHIVWALIVYKKNNKDALSQFNKISFTVWLIWLVPYIIGLIMGMQH